MAYHVKHILLHVLQDDVRQCNQGLNPFLLKDHTGKKEGAKTMAFENRFEKQCCFLIRRKAPKNPCGKVPPRKRRESMPVCERAPK